MAAMTSTIAAPAAHTTAETSFADVMAYIALHASAEDIERIHLATRDRSRALRSVRAATIRTGSKVALVNLSPKYLNGLTGVVGAIKGARADVLLDAESTSRLAWSGRSRYSIAPGAAEFTVPGVPLTAMTIQD